jgi:3-methyladenine DNA glycosylase AlkD
MREVNENLMEQGIPSRRREILDRMPAATCRLGIRSREVWRESFDLFSVLKKKKQKKKPPHYACWDSWWPFLLDFVLAQCILLD